MRGRPRRARPGDERLSPLDASFLRVEERGAPMPIAALAVLDGTALLTADGRLPAGTVQELVGRRIRDIPRLHQVIVRPRHRLRRPRWADAPGFDIGRHVRVRPLPQPADEDALLAVCRELDERPLATDRPLWEMWFLPGMPGGRLGLLLRMQHVVADGIAALALLTPLFDAAPPLTAAGTPGAPPGRAGRWWTAPAGLVQQLRAVAREGRAPALSINRPVGRRRALALVRADLAAAKEAAHRHGGTVNDVLLAAAAGGVRAVLAARGELSPDLVLKVSVPVSVRRPGQTGGNRTGVRIVPVPLGEADPAARLARIAAVTAAQRHRPPYVPGGRLLQRWTARTMHRQRLVNLWLSNLHGPPEPLRLGGARVLELFQLGAVQGNVALAVGALSYAGQLNLGVVADADVVPDLDLFAAGVADTLDRLGAGPGGA